jgi:hypothetical protein
VALLHFGNNLGFKIKNIVGGTPTNSFCACLLQGKLHCIHELFTLEKNISTKPLPRNLLLQMDNCVKDNKNQHLLSFLSLLIMKDVFEEVKLGFLVIGHTHENIDGCFGYLSKKLN